MTKRNFFVIIIGLVILAIAIIIIIRSVLLKPSENTSLINSLGTPPVTKVVPQAVTRGIETWTGVLGLEPKATLKVGEKVVYILQINKADASVILKKQGYISGDTLNVMGKLTGETIEMSGANKMTK